MIYRTLLAALAALVIASPVFAEDTTTATDTTGTTQTTGDTTEQGTTTTKININTATTKELMTVKGINSAKARAIVSYRKRHGDFKTIDEIANVKGFKKLNPTTLQNITNQLTTETN